MVGKKWAAVGLCLLSCLSCSIGVMAVKANEEDGGNREREERRVAVLPKEEAEGTGENFYAQGVVIDEDVFSETSVRLNTEIYEVAGRVINDVTKEAFLGEPENRFAQAYKEYVNPLMPMALAACETGIYSDHSYTWVPAIYSRPIAEAGVDMAKLSIMDVDEHFYLAVGLEPYLSCGNNCTAPQSGHWHISPIGTQRNDCDSLGPLQILRRYVYKMPLAYSDGTAVSDLMSWEDNVKFVFHQYGKATLNASIWCKDYYPRNDYEMIVLMALMHNQGAGYVYASSPTTSWDSSYYHNADSIFQYARALTTESNVMQIETMAMQWYEANKENMKAGGQWGLLGDAYGYKTAALRQLLSELNVSLSDYASALGIKQAHPVRALLQYASLKVLYNSGRLEEWWGR